MSIPKRDARLALDPVVDYLGDDCEVLAVKPSERREGRPLTIHQPIAEEVPIPACGLGGVATVDTLGQYQIGELTRVADEKDRDVKPCGSCFGNHQGAATDTPNFPYVGECDHPATGGRR